MAKLVVGVLYAALAVAAVAGGPQAPDKEASSNSSPNLAQAPKQGTPALQFDVMSPLVVQRADGASLTATVFIKGDGVVAATPSLALSLVDADDHPVAAPPNPVFQIGDVGRIPVPGKLTISTLGLQLPAHGYLLLTTMVDGKAVGPAAAREIKLLQPSPSSRQWQLLFAALVIAVAIAVSGYVAVPADSRNIRDRMGSPIWADSWASNIAVGGALLTFVVNGAFFPEQTRLLPKVAYVFFTLFWTTVVALAPAVYGTFRTPVQVRDGGAVSIQYQGFVGIFLVAAVLTLWGAFGQLLTTFFAIDELAYSYIISPSVSHALFALNALLTLIALIYSFVSIRQYVDRFAAPPSAAAGAQPRKFSRNLSAGHLAQLSPPLESWQLI